MKRLIKVEEIWPERYGCLEFIRDWAISIAATALMMIIAKITHSWPFE
jgi:hypothetical protein